jgi:hypothetical protein
MKLRVLETKHNIFVLVGNGHKFSDEDFVITDMVMVEVAQLIDNGLQ